MERLPYVGSVGMLGKSCENVDTVTALTELIDQCIV